MMSALIKIAAVATALNGVFHRLGRAWTTEGTIVAPDDFTEAEWEILQGTSMLHITPAPDGAEVEAQVNLTVADAVKAAIPKLDAGAFDGAGVPKLDALKEALPEMAKKITAKLVAGVWAELNPPK